MIQKFKLILIGIVGLFSLFTVIGLLIPSSVKISRGIIIQADSATVAKAIMSVEQWPLWMQSLREPNGSLISVGNDQGNPSVNWGSLGQKGRGQITKLGTERDMIRLRYAFPGMNTANGAIRIRAVNPQQTEVLWMMEYPLRWYPWERFEGIFMDNIIGRVLEALLNDLSRHLCIFFYM